MQPYKKHRPTGFDPAGAFLPDSQEWLVAPVSRNRDSGPLAESNFSKALEMLGGESETVEVHRFGHWGPGWYEIIIIAPGSPAEAIGNELEARLSDYPVLDEEDFSRREWEEAATYWEHESVRGRYELIKRAGDISIFAARRAEIPEDPSGHLWELIRPDAC